EFVGNTRALHPIPLRSGLVQHRESLRDLVFAATFYPDHKRTWAGESKKRSLRRPPQFGQMMGRLGWRAALGKSIWNPMVNSIRPLMWSRATPELGFMNPY